MHNRPLLPQYRGPYTAPTTTAPTGGQNEGKLIAEADSLRVSLGYTRFSSLKAWCDDGQPLTTDGDGLELMIERLCIVWVNRGGGSVDA
jgi:hypothetical protein